jgi:5-methyltetrahydrofolate--homocysteine methyltransferase
VPLLIGGATTSRAHTAIKIAPNYAAPVVYVPDASRAVGVVTKLLSIDMRAGYVAEIAADYEKAARAARQQEGRAAGDAGGGARQPLSDRRSPTAPVKPKQAGRARAARLDLATLAEYIDWGPFFQTWDLAGSYPKILDDAKVGETARNVFADGQAMLKRIVERKMAHAPTRLRPVSRPTRRRRHRDLCRRSAPTG